MVRVEDIYIGMKLVYCGEREDVSFDGIVGTVYCEDNGNDEYSKSFVVVFEDCEEQYEYLNNGARLHCCGGQYHENRCLYLYGSRDCIDDPIYGLDNWEEYDGDFWRV